MRTPGSDTMAPIVLALCERINTPRALSVWLCFKYNQKALLDLPPADIATRNSEEFQLAYFITEYLSKYKGLKTGIDTRAVALEKWRLSEQRCGETNALFRNHRFRPFPGRVEGLLFEAQRKISMVLGRLHYPAVFSGCKWGPGATFDLGRTDATPDKKISQAISVTARALPFLRADLESDPHWAAVILGCIPEGPFSLTRDCFNIVRGSRFLTVPKSAKTDRCIAAEPTGNSFLQQGIHAYIRRRLKRFGVDLDDQSINQQLAQDAYSCGLSTLDLSAASDTISRELVRHLLPFDWYELLNAVRSHETLVDGQWIQTEKFASMGNAFCFELETLIFWALASSASGVSRSVDGISVYGDDIIVPRRSYDEVVNLLTLCGFEVNNKKSFKDGYFFESCGKHYHRGREVTPVYQKEVLSHPSEFIRAHNRLIRFASRVPSASSTSLVLGATRRLTSLWPFRPFPRIPYGVPEDGGYLRPLSEFSLDRNHGFRCHVYDFVPRLSEAREDAVYAYKLRRFVNQNPSREGYAGNATKGVWRTKVRWVPEHAIELASA